MESYNNIIVIRISISPKHPEFVATEILRNKHPDLFLSQHNGSPVFGGINRDKWFAYRIRLFNSLARKCLETQSVMPIKIFLLFDKNDVGLVEKYLDVDSSIYESIYVDTISDCGAEHIYNWLESEDILDNIAITRIDSDDLISTNFLAESNKQYVQHKKDNPDSHANRVWPRHTWLTNLKHFRDTTLVFRRPIFTEYYESLSEPVDVYRRDYSDIWDDPNEPKILCDNVKFMLVIHEWNTGTNSIWDIPSFIIPMLGVEDKKPFYKSHLKDDFITTEFKLPKF